MQCGTTPNQLLYMTGSKADTRTKGTTLQDSQLSLFCTVSFLLVQQVEIESAMQRGDTWTTDSNE